MNAVASSKQAYSTSQNPNSKAREARSKKHIKIAQKLSYLYGSLSINDEPGLNAHKTMARPPKEQGHSYSMSQLTLLNLKDIPRACMKRDKKIKITDHQDFHKTTVNTKIKAGNTRNDPLLDQLPNTMYSFNGEQCLS